MADNDRDIINCAADWLANGQTFAGWLTHARLRHTDRGARAEGDEAGRAAERKACLRYLRLMADGLYAEGGPVNDKGLIRDSALLAATAADLEQGLHFDAARIAQLTKAKEVGNAGA